MAAFLKGPLALAIRYALYMLGGGLVGVGVAAQTLDGSQLCLDVAQTADLAANAIVMILGGGAVSGGAIIWSRIVKKAGGVT